MSGERTAESGQRGDEKKENQGKRRARRRDEMRNERKEERKREKSGERGKGDHGMMTLTIDGGRVWKEGRCKKT